MQSDVSDRHAHVPLNRSQRHANPGMQDPPQNWPCPSDWSVQESGAAVEVVVLLVLVDVVLLVEDVDDVLDVVGPAQPHWLPPIAVQSSAGRGQSRPAVPHPGGDSCEQSDVAATQAHVPLGRSHRQTSPPAHAPPHVPPCPSACNEHGPDASDVEVVLFVLVDVVVDDDVLEVVGPSQPHTPPPIALQPSAGRGQSRSGSPQPGGDSCEQSDAGDTHAHVPLIRSHRQTSAPSHVPPHMPPRPSGRSWHASGGRVVVVVLVLVVLVLVLLVLDDDVVVLDVVGPLHPQALPFVGRQSSDRRGQSRSGEPQPGGASCEQSDVAGTHAQVAFIRSHRHVSPSAHVPPHMPPSAVDWSAQVPEPLTTDATHVPARPSSSETPPPHVPRPSAFATALARRVSALVVHSGSGFGAPVRNAFRRHFALAYASLPTAVVFAAVHFASPVIGAAKPERHPSTAAATTPTSSTTGHEPAASAFAKAV